MKISIRHFALFLFWLVCLIFAQSAGAQEIVGSFGSPGTEPRGLAWDGEYLWCADAATDSVYKLNTSNGAVISSFPFLIEPSYGGITWSDDDNIWVANGSYIYKVNPTNGDTIDYFSCPGG